MGNFLTDVLEEARQLMKTNFYYILLAYPMLKNLSLKQIEVIFRKSLLLELYQKGYLYS